MSVWMGPPGTVAIRDYLIGRGIRDEDLSWDYKTGQVLYRGTPLIKPAAIAGGRTFATPADLDAALNRIQAQNVTIPRVQMESLLRQLVQQVTQPATTDFTSHPLYQQALQAAQQNAQLASQRALEELNARRLLPSSYAASTVAQIQQQAQSQAVSQVLPTILNALLQERQLGIQGLASALQGYQNLEQLDLENRRLQIQKESDQLQQAIARTQTLGRVATLADAQILGVPVGTSSWEALNAAAERAQRLRLEQEALDIQRRQVEATAAATRVQALLDIWKATGTAPAGLEEYGVKPGTPYSAADWLDLMRKLEYEKALKDWQEQQELEKAVPEIQKQFGTDRVTAEAIYELWQNPTREAALADYYAHERQLRVQEGVNTEVLRKAIDVKWPPGTGAAGAAGSTSGTTGGAAYWGLQISPGWALEQTQGGSTLLFPELLERLRQTVPQP